MILDELRDDRRMAITCSRVCKAWYFVALPLIMRAVHIHETASTYLFLPFSRILRTRPDVGELILELHLELQARILEIATDDDVLSDRPEYNFAALAAVLVRMPALKVLKFTNAFWRSEGDMPISQVAHTGLRSLTFVKEPTSDSDHRVHDIVRWFPNLKELHVLTDHASHTLPFPPDPLCTSLSLEHLEILSDSSCLEHLIQGFTLTNTVRTLKHLACHLWLSSPTALGAFFAKAGPSIRTLELLFEDEKLPLDLMLSLCWSSHSTCCFSDNSAQSTATTPSIYRNARILKSWPCASSKKVGPTIS